MDREIRGAENATKKALLLDFLEVVDILKKAIDYEGRNGVSMKGGGRAVQRQVLDILERYGVVRLQSVGKEFDLTKRSGGERDDG